MEDQQKHIRSLEQEKIHTQHEMGALQERIAEMKEQMDKRNGLEDTVSCLSPFFSCFYIFYFFQVLSFQATVSIIDMFLFNFISVYYQLERTVFYNV